jgi:membrane protease YdiL (CAAX protease family)
VSSTAGNSFAARLRGFGPAGTAAILLILVASLVPVLPLSAILVLVWARRSRTPWKEIGFARPGNWAFSLAMGVLFGIVFKLVMKAVVMPLFGAPTINPTYHYLVGNLAALPGTAFAIVVRAGFGEETLFRGYLFERLGRLLGTGGWARTAIVLLTSGLFGLAHYPDQGLAGVQQAAITGMVFGTIFAWTGRLWVPICAHAAFDLTALAIIYWDLESVVAHLVFR